MRVRRRDEFYALNEQFARDSGRDLGGVAGRHGDEYAAARSAFLREPIERIGELFGDMADAADGQIDRTHAACHPQDAVGFIAFLRETSGGKKRVGGKHAKLPARPRVDAARDIEPITRVAEPSFDHTGRPHHEGVVSGGDVGCLGRAANAGDAAPDRRILLGQELHLDRAIGRGDQDPYFVGRERHGDLYTNVLMRALSDRRRVGLRRL